MKYIAKDEFNQLKTEYNFEHIYNNETELFNINDIKCINKFNIHKNIKYHIQIINNLLDYNILIYYKSNNIVYNYLYKTYNYNKPKIIQSIDYYYPNNIQIYKSDIFSLKLKFKNNIKFDYLENNSLSSKFLNSLEKEIYKDEIITKFKNINIKYINNLIYYKQFLNYSLNNIKCYPESSNLKLYI